MALKKQLNLFFDDLAYYPHCTDNFADGQYRAKKTEAIRKKYIEFNQPCLVSYFIFDLDYPESALAWREENLPPPFWVAQNPKMGMYISATVYYFPIPQRKSQALSQCSTLQKFRLLWLENSKLMQGTAEN